MKQSYTDLILTRTPSPDFARLDKILSRKSADRPTLFEFFLNSRLYSVLTGEQSPDSADRKTQYKHVAKAFRQAGYDYCTIIPTDYRFPARARSKEKSLSLNEGFVITDRKSLESYDWQNPDDFDYTILADESLIPEGMKWIVHGPGGVLENVITLTGYDNLCYMSLDDPALTKEIFDHVGSGLLRYYENSLDFDLVGAAIVNDDWGFKSQTMLSPAQMREYVIPWHTRIVAEIHRAGKPAILHSCGELAEVMNDITDVINFDAKHSYEDTIMPVEQFYDLFSSRIAILGGIDVDFVIRHTPDEVFQRSKAMVQRAPSGYALGTGNSVPDYVPDEHYFALTAAAFFGD